MVTQDVPRCHFDESQRSRDIFQRSTFGRNTPKLLGYVGPSPTPGSADRSQGHAADTDRSCGRARAWRYSACDRPFPSPSAASAFSHDSGPPCSPLQHARAGEGELQMQLVHAPHQCKIGGRHRTWLVVKTAATDVQHGRLPRQWEIMNAVNHRLALSNPALSSALSKKSFSSVSSPIFACSALMSTSGVDGLALELVANTSAAPSSS